MTKRKVEDILDDSLPAASKELYHKKWMQLMEFIGEIRRPTETDYLQYFDYLHEEKKHKASSIWSTYSSLNSVHQREFAEKLQSFPRVTQLLKTYNNTYERKVASIFESAEINNFLEMDLSTPYWVLCKAVVSIAIPGGLRSAEIKEIDFNNVAKKGDSYEITVWRKKQQGEKVKSMFIVPPPLAAHLTNYIVTLKATLGEDVSGSLMKGTPRSRFVNQPMGKNKLSSIGKAIAEILNLENAHTYTGHCFRRTAATMAVDAGATTQQLQRAFGWKSVHTAQRYVDESSKGAQSMANMLTQTMNTTISSSSSSTITSKNSNEGVDEESGNNNQKYSTFMQRGRTMFITSIKITEFRKLQAESRLTSLTSR